MTSGAKFMVLESADEVIERVIEFRRTIANRPEIADHTENVSTCEEPMLAAEKS
jgi:uncharacterized protein YlzI (FlbEa/FlbD family)